MATIKSWLEGLKLERYEDAFAARGVSYGDLPRLKDTDLDAMGITLAGHRNRILKNLPGGGSGPDRRSRINTGEDFGLNAVLGSLTSMKYELEDAEIDAGAGAAPARPPLPSDFVDRDLDSIIEDLCAFGTGQPSTFGAGSAEGVGQKTSEDVGSRADSVGAAPSWTGTEEDGVAEDEGDSVAVMRRVKHPARTQEEVEQRLQAFRNRVSVASKAAGQLTHGELEALMKEEKIRIAMEKLAEASVSKDVIKIYIDEFSTGTKDGGASTARTMLVESIETARMVCDKLVTKARLEADPNWTIVEDCPELGVERTLEDHESVGDAYRMWPPSCQYRFIMRRNNLKYDLFIHPERYLPTQLKEEVHDTASGSERTERAKRILLQELYSNSNRIPDIKGYLNEKEGGKKWKKKYFLLRASGIYSSSKGESEASKDLQCFVKFDEVDVCQGCEFVARSKAPSDLCLCFRPRKRKQVIDPEEVLAICASDESEFAMWWAGVRLAKHGVALRDNYDDTMRKLDELVKLGAVASNAKKPLMGETRAVPLELSNKALIDQWKVARASSAKPGVSAATGVKFIDTPSAPAPAAASSSDPLFRYGWYHGDINRDQSEAALQLSNFETGSFLVRSSTSKPGDLVLSVCFDGKPHHFHVRTLPNPGGAPQFALDNGQPFASLEALVDYYGDANDRLPTTLTSPIMRTGASLDSIDALLPPGLLVSSATVRLCSSPQQRKKSQHTQLLPARK